MISRKIRVAGKLRNFHTVTYEFSTRRLHIFKRGLCKMIYTNHAKNLIFLICYGGAFRNIKYNCCWLVPLSCTLIYMVKKLMILRQNASQHVVLANFKHEGRDALARILYFIFYLNAQCKKCKTLFLLLSFFVKSVLVNLS